MNEHVTTPETPIVPIVQPAAVVAPTPTASPWLLPLGFLAIVTGAYLVSRWSKL